MKLRDLLSILQTMEPDATVAIRATGTSDYGETVEYDIRITHAEQIGAGTQAVIRLTSADDLTINSRRRMTSPSTDV
jgi:hypothetical protein